VGTAKKFKGYWWLPANPECHWFGNVRWRPGESPKFKLYYRTVDEAISPPRLQAESILGLDEGGTPVSLLRLGFSKGSRPGLLSQREYIAGHCLHGIHVASRDEFRAHRVNLWAQYLSAWVREEGFVDERSFEIKYESPPDRSFEITNGVTIHLCHKAQSFARNQQRKLSYQIFFSAEKKQPFNWRQAFRYIDGLVSLLHFACLRRVRPTAITFEHLDHASVIADVRIPDKIELFSGAIKSVEQKQLHEHDFVFMFGDVETRFGQLCRQWLEFCSHQKEALACYAPTVYFDLPDTLRLVSLTQALEAYHQGFYRPRRDVKLKDRIIELCNAARSRVENIVGDVDQFAATVTNSRDYYTHHHPSIRSRGNIATGSKLTIMCYHLEFLFRLGVLRQFGLDADKFRVLVRQLPQRIIEY